MEFQVEKMPEIERDPQPDGPPIQVGETVFQAWVAKEYNRPEMEMASETGRISRESF